MSKRGTQARQRTRETIGIFNNIKSNFLLPQLSLHKESQPLGRENSSKK
jgi:hypothetical protein